MIGVELIKSSCQEKTGTISKQQGQLTKLLEESLDMSKILDQSYSWMRDTLTTQIGLKFQSGSETELQYMNNSINVHKI